MDKCNGTIVMFTLDRRIDRRILLEAESLQGDGWDVRIVAMPTDCTETEDPPYVVRIGVGASEQTTGDSLILYLNRLAAMIFPANGAVMRFVKSFVWRFIRNPETFFSRLFAEAVLQHKADIYVAHDLPMILVAVAAAKQHGGKLVYDSHELFVEQELSNSERKMWEAIENKHIASFDAVITINVSIAEELKKRYHLENVKVIHNCDLFQEASCPTPKLFHNYFNLFDDVAIVLFQGGLSKGRNLENLVESISYVQTSNLHLIVLGNGVLLSLLQQLACKYRIEDRVHFHKAVPQKVLLQYTASADVGIIPYQATCLNNYYCTPNKLFEFIAAGLPVVATDLPEIRRIVHNNGIGVVGETESAPQLAVLLDMLCSDSEKLKECKRAVLIAGKKINWQCESQILIDVYRELND